MTEKILVIKQGALGDLVTASGAFSMIRQNYPNAHLTLLTEARFRELAEKMGYFDDYIIDNRSKNPFTLFRLTQKIRRAQFTFIFDLQNSRRTGFYYKLLGPGRRPCWSGIAPGCSHPQTRPDRKSLPASFRFADQLRVAGLSLGDQQHLGPDLSWMRADLSALSVQQGLDIEKPYVLLIPGSSLSGAHKRWPAPSFAALATLLLEAGIRPVLVAGPEDHEPVKILTERVSGLCDLSQKLSLFDIAELARKAVLVVGNDTGPTLIAAGVGAQTFILWSSASDPKIYAPQGEGVQVLFQERLADLSVQKVWDTIRHYF